MREKDVEAAMEPFRQTATAGTWGSGGTGLGLPLTKALAEANRAHFSIQSAPNAGTLIEVAFPPTRVVAQYPCAVSAPRRRFTPPERRFCRNARQPPCDERRLSP